MTTTMKAWRLPAYNEDIGKAIDSMTLEEDIPVPSDIGADQVLVKVKYASVNPIDWKLFSGGFHGNCPIAAFPYTPGFDVAGVIEKVGSGVTNVAAGDSVIADIGLVESCTDPAPTPSGPAGAFAEYAAVPANLCVKVASDLKAIAGLPLAGLTAYQGLFTGSASSFAGESLGDAKEGSKVLILGAAGGVGTLAVQMAKQAKCYVVATASETKMPNDDNMTKIEYVKSLGADVVIDYRSKDWGEELSGQEFDLIYDCVGEPQDLLEKAPKVLKKGGTFVSIANFGDTSGKSDDVRFAVFLLKSTDKDLKALVDMVEKGELKVPIDSEYKFSETKEALKRNLGGKSVGKVIINIEES